MQRWPDQLTVKELLFVVHKHRATSLHYDFRLEINGVMPSWSIPKGPTLDHRVRRLAMPTGDHSLEYISFEGVLDMGEGRTSTVMIWDEGVYVPEIEVARGVRRELSGSEDANSVAASQLSEGGLKFRLSGRKLNGSFALIRTRGMKGRESWLLIKHNDDFCIDGYDANDFNISAVSGF